VVEDLHDAQLVLQGVQVRSLFLISLDGHVPSILVYTQLHLCVVARPQGFQDLELVKV